VFLFENLKIICFLDHHAVMLHVFHHNWCLMLTVWLEVNLLQHSMMSQIFLFKQQTGNKSLNSTRKGTGLYSSLL